MDVFAIPQKKWDRDLSMAQKRPKSSQCFAAQRYYTEFSSMYGHPKPAPSRGRAMQTKVSNDKCNIYGHRSLAHLIQRPAAPEGRRLRPEDADVIESSPLCILGHQLVNEVLQRLKFLLVHQVELLYLFVLGGSKV